MNNLNYCNLFEKPAVAGQFGPGCFQTPKNARPKPLTTAGPALAPGLHRSRRDQINGRKTRRHWGPRWEHQIRLTMAHTPVPRCARNVGPSKGQGLERHRVKLDQACIVYFWARPAKWSEVSGSGFADAPSYPAEQQPRVSL
jgi:hypothetical protein